MKVVVEKRQDGAVRHINVELDNGFRYRITENVQSYGLIINKSEDSIIVFPRVSNEIEIK